MKPVQILNVMELAKSARQINQRFSPLFRGHAGLGKSEILQEWVTLQREKDPNFGFIDLRIAYLEAPDFIGHIKELQVAERWRTTYCLPSFWPTEGSGLLLLEEPSRGTTSVMNCLMQLMTDRKVGPDYKLPDGWIIAAADNPADANYDVNTMDTALSDRFEVFEIDYDPTTFFKFAEKANWDSNIVLFLKSGEWAYKDPTSINSKDGGKYISPRTWSKMNAAEKAGARDRGKQFHHMICSSILGKHIGNAYYKVCWDDAPVTAQDLINNAETALAKLKEQSSPKTYQGDRVAVTVESIIANYGGLSEKNGGKCKADQIDEDLMAQVATIIPSDQAINLIRECGFKGHKDSGGMNNFLKGFMERHTDCVDILRSNIKISKVTDAKTTPKK